MLRIGNTESAYWDESDIPASMRLMKAHGYDTVDYNGFVNTEKPLFRVGLSDFEKTVKEHADIIREAGLELIQCHGPWRWPPRDFEEADRQERFEKMALSIHGAAIMQCPNFVIHPIMPYGCGKPDDPKRFYDMNLDFYSRLTKIAEEEKVTICLENMPMPELTLHTPGQILNFVKTIDSEYLRVCLDTGHCTMCGTTPAEAVRLLGKEYLRVLHIHDNDGVHDYHYTPYYGVIDWQDFKTALKEIGFEGSVSLETAVPKKIPEPAREKMRIGLAEIAKEIARQ